MDRAVILVLHKRGGGRQSDEAFLADARSKAAIEFAGIGSVYEAGEEGGELYWTRELLPGTTFAELHREGRKLAPYLIAGFLRQVGEAMAYLEQRAITTLPLGPEHVVLGEHGIVRIINLAVAGQPGPGDRARDLATTGQTFGYLLDPGAEGKSLIGGTRTRRLLGMMMGHEEGIELTWAQVAGTAGELEQSLASEARDAEERYGREMSIRRRKMACTVTAVILAVCVVALLLLLNRRVVPEARDLTAMVEIPRGTYLDHEGKEGELAGFWIDAHEVTIAEYAGFLDALASVEESMRSAYDHDTQPATKRDHIPDDWYMVLAAARAGEGGWGPVDQFAGEGSRRVYGLGGNVAEWTKNPERNPAFPMNARSPVACGGSFMRVEGGVRKRTWIPARGERRRDLGFRIVRREAPQGGEDAPGKSAK